jgi:hypothetical protein
VNIIYLLQSQHKYNAQQQPSSTAAAVLCSSIKGSEWTTTGVDTTTVWTTGCGGGTAYTGGGVGGGI